MSHLLLNFIRESGHRVDFVHRCFIHHRLPFGKNPTPIKDDSPIKRTLRQRWITPCLHVHRWPSTNAPTLPLRTSRRRLGKGHPRIPLETVRRRWRVKKSPPAVSSSSSVPTNALMFRLVYIPSSASTLPSTIILSTPHSSSNGVLCHEFERMARCEPCLDRKTIEVLVPDLRGFCSMIDESAVSSA